jgi:hypothetical protein
MPKLTLPTRPDPTQFTQHVEALRGRLQDRLEAIGPQALANLSGAEYLLPELEPAGFAFTLWRQVVWLELPGCSLNDRSSRQVLSPPSQALALYYFITADGTPPEARWVSFADLPDGRFYNQAFQSYTGAELARAFGNDLMGFEAAAQQIGGMRLAPDPQIPGDQAFRFGILPRLSAAVVYWQGDEDFPASAQVLFEHTTPHYLPTDVCAYAGSSLTRSLIKARG